MEGTMMLRSVGFASIVWLAAAAEAEPRSRAGGRFTISDPRGDDDGPGAYTYPTDPAYTAGAFDLTTFEVVPRGETAELRVTVAAKIEDPWNSREWKGNGFSVQMVF